MKDILKTKLNRLIYTKLIRPVLFKIDSENVHNSFIKAGRIIDSSALTKKIVSYLFSYQNKALEQEYFGLRFRSPVGLSAGFDKNAEIVGVLESIGFGFIEVGSISAKASMGNKGKRLRRMINKNSLWVNLGLNNKGADEIYNFIKNKKHFVPIGINVAKTNCPETVDVDVAIKDYVYTLDKFRDVGGYFTINISCPNSYGGQPFVDSELFERLMKNIVKLKIRKPIFVKLSPDLSKKEIDVLIKISIKYNISGFICSNLTKNHGLSKGGISGKYLEDRSNKLLSYVYHNLNGLSKRPILIGVGGIFSATDAYKKIKLGANLVQLITGMVYNGPGLIGEINNELVDLLRKDGFKNIREAVGTYYKRENKKTVLYDS